MLAGFPLDPALRVEIAKCLRKWCAGVRLDSKYLRCGSNEQCEAVITIAVETMRFWHAPVELREIHDALFPPRDPALARQ